MDRSTVFSGLRPGSADPRSDRNLWATKTDAFFFMKSFHDNEDLLINLDPDRPFMTLADHIKHSKERVEQLLEGYRCCSSLLRPGEEEARSQSSIYRSAYS